MLDLVGMVFSSNLSGGHMTCLESLAVFMRQFRVTMKSPYFSILLESHTSSDIGQVSLLNPSFIKKIQKRYFYLSSEN